MACTVREIQDAGLTSDEEARRLLQDPRTAWRGPCGGSSERH
jgi:hypothetical protein